MTILWYVYELDLIYILVVYDNLVGMWTREVKGRGDTRPTPEEHAGDNDSGIVYESNENNVANSRAPSR